MKPRRTVSLEIEGYSHNLRIFSTRVTDPVIISLHGGPGACDRYFMRNLKKYLKNFSIVCWDQIGSGYSYHFWLPKEEMRIDRMLSDLDAIVDYVRIQFQKKKVILLAHSWGTILGTAYVNRNSDKVSLYLSCGHLVNAKIAEEISYRNLLDLIKKKKDLKNLAKIGKPKHGLYKSLRDRIKKMRLNQKYRGSVYEINHENIDVLGIGPSVLKEYSPIGILRYLLGVHFSWKSLKHELMNTDLSEEMKKLSVPTYIFAGQYDNVTPQEPVLECLEKIGNEHISYFVFEECSHSPHFEKPSAFSEILNRIVEEKRIDLSF